MPSIEKKITITWDESEVAELINEENSEMNGSRESRWGQPGDRVEMQGDRIVLSQSIDISTFQRLAQEISGDDSLHWGEGEVECEVGCVSVTFEVSR